MSAMKSESDRKLVALTSPPAIVHLLSFVYLQVVAAAKAGAVAQVDVALLAGPTGLEPTQTSFFQALGIATKINKGSIEIISNVQLCTKGLKVGPSEAVLLGKLGLKPFAYGRKQLLCLMPWRKISRVCVSGSCLAVVTHRMCAILDPDSESVFLAHVSLLVTHSNAQ